jgi:S-formylglutathione hydrolase FrmB
MNKIQESGEKIHDNDLKEGGQTAEVEMANVDPIQDMEKQVDQKVKQNDSGDSKATSPSHRQEADKDIDSKTEEEKALENKRRKIAYFMGAYAALVLAIGNYLVADLSAKFGVLATAFQAYAYLIIGIGYHVYASIKFKKSEEYPSYISYYK